MVQFVSFESARSWLAHGEQVETLQPVSFRDGRFVDSDFQMLDDLAEEGSWHAGRYALAEEMLFEAIKSGAIQTIGSARNEDKNLDIIDPGFIKDCDTEQDVTGLVLIGVHAVYDSIYVNLEHLVFYFAHRPTKLREKFAEQRLKASPSDSSTDTPSIVQIKATSGAILKCKNWLMELASKQTEKPIKKDLREQALEQFPNLSGRGFDRAWDETAPDFWKAPGRTPKP